MCPVAECMITKKNNVFEDYSNQMNSEQYDHDGLRIITGEISKAQPWNFYAALSASRWHHLVLN